MELNDIQFHFCNFVNSNECPICRVEGEELEEIEIIKNDLCKKSLEVIKRFKKLIEKLSDIEHQRWADWQKYMHSKCFTADHNEEGLVCWCNPKIEMMQNTNNVVVHNDCLIIPEESVKNWERQIKTDYKNLGEKEKESDREQVRRYLPLVEQFIIEELEKQEKEYELAKQAPMGVSQWKNHGEKYGYSKFWEDKTRAEICEKIENSKFREIEPNEALQDYQIRANQFKKDKVLFLNIIKE